MNIKPSVHLKITYDDNMVNIETPRDMPEEVKDFMKDHEFYFGLLRDKCEHCKGHRQSFGLQPNSNTNTKAMEKMCFSIADAISEYMKETKIYEKK